MTERGLAMICQNNLTKPMIIMDIFLMTKEDIIPEGYV